MWKGNKSEKEREKEKEKNSIYEEDTKLENY